MFSGRNNFSCPEVGEKGHNSKGQWVKGPGIPELKMNYSHAGPGHSAGIAFYIEKYPAQANSRAAIKKICGKQDQHKGQNQQPADLQGFY